MLTLNMSYAQSVEKNTDTKYIDFIKSFKEETKSNIIDFRRIINIEAPMSKEEAQRFVYHTDDTTKLYCVEFNYSNENEEFRGITGTFLWLPNKCLKINMGDYFFVAYNSYQCVNSCPDPNKLRECFKNKEFNVFLTLCVVDKTFNLRDSMLVCNDDGYDSFVKGCLNPKNGKFFLFYTHGDLEKPEMNKAYMYEVNKENLKFEIIKEENVSKDMPTDDLIGVIEKLGWKKAFFE